MDKPEKKLDKVKKHIHRRASQQVKLVKRVFYSIKLNFWPILLFLAIASALNVFVAMTITSAATRATLKAAGLEYLCPDNLLQALLSPVGILSIIFVALCVSAIAVFEIGGLIHACFLSQAGRKVSFSDMCAHGFEATKRSMLSKNMLIIPFMMIMMPFTSEISFTCTGLSFTIPEFIMDAINQNNLYFTLMTLYGTLLFIVAFINIYSIPEYIIERKSFYQACKDTRSGFRRHCIATPIALALSNLAFYLLCVGASAIISVVLVKIGAFFSDMGLVTEQSITSTFIFNTVALAQAVLAPAFSMGALTVLYVQLGLCNITVDEYERSTAHVKFSGIQKGFVVCLIVACVACNVCLRAGDFYTLNFEESSRPQIVAHRGDSTHAPENTEPAFQAAIDVGLADWIELDVHQTKDGVIIISHDENLKRVSGKSINVSDITYAELQQLDTGSWYSEEFSYVRCMKLDDALKMMKGHVNVQIELKPTGNETNLEESVIQIIKDNDMVDDTLIICLKSAPLKRIKEIDPSINTAYCMAIAWESIEKMEFSDDFSIEENNVTARTVRDAHAAGKRVFAWTCNSEDNVQYLVDCGVDGIVTDDPAMVYSALNKVKYNGGFPRVLRILLDNLVYGV